MTKKEKSQYAIRYKVPSCDGICVFVEKRNFEKDLWVVKSEGSSAVLNTDGDLEYEMSPSNRSDDFIRRTRFSLDEAWKRGKKLVKKLSQNYKNKQ